MLDRATRAKLFQPFGDERAQYLMLSIVKNGERCTHELCDETHMPQSSVSYHMKILYESGLVERRRDGKWTYYRMSKKGIEVLQRELIYIATECEKYLKTMK